jgi:hypothetical protein
MRALISALAAALLSLGAGAQETGVLRITVTAADADGTAIPIPRAQLLISDNPSTREPRRVRTGADGTIDLTLPAGNYTVESETPVNLGGRSFAWTQMLDVAAGRDTVLALTGDNAEVGVADAAAGAPAATHGDSAALFNKWQHSVAEIWTPARHATGFVLDARGLIATNDRALGEAAEVEVEFGAGAERLKVAGRVIASDRTRGVAIVWIDPEVVKSRTPIAPSCAAAPPAIAHDDRVVSLIAPILEPKSAIPGTAIRPDAQSFRADWRLDSGSAGGPVFAADGTAIGITVAGDENETPGRRSDSYVIPLHNACSVLAAAGQKMAGAAPPAGTPLRTEAGLPRPRAARLGEPQAPRQQPPMIRADDFDITLMTPAMIAHDQSVWSPRSYFGYWSPYIANAPQVLFVRTTPQFEESFWKTLARGAASTQGVALPPMPSFSANFLSMKAYCGAAEVRPIRAFTVEMPVEKGGRIREGLYVFAPDDFGAHCGTVRFELFSEKSPNRGDSRTIDPEIFTKLAGGSR